MWRLGLISNFTIMLLTQLYIRDAILLICGQHLHNVSFHPVIYQRCHFTHMLTTCAWRVISPSYISEMPFYSYADNICMTCHFTKMVGSINLVYKCLQQAKKVSGNTFIFRCIDFRCFYIFLLLDFITVRSVW